MDTAKIISIRVRDARIAKGWSQEKLAEEADLTSRTISNVESGKDIYLGTLISIVNALEYPLVDILGTVGPEDSGKSG